MPTTRRRTSRTPKPGLTKPERHLLLTGDCCPPKGTWADQGELKFSSFMLISPACRDELRALWEANRDELLAAWKADKKRGLPWAAKEFDNV